MFFWNSCFFNDPTDVGNLISGSSAFSKSSLNIWKFMVHIPFKPDLENFEHYFASVCVCVYTQSCRTLCEPMDCRQPGSSVHGISQARILVWISISFSRGSSQPGMEPTSLTFPAWHVDSLPLAPPGKQVITAYGLLQNIQYGSLGPWAIQYTVGPFCLLWRCKLPSFPQL